MSRHLQGVESVDRRSQYTVANVTEAKKHGRTFISYKIFSIALANIVKHVPCTLYNSTSKYILKYVFIILQRCQYGVLKFVFKTQITRLIIKTLIRILYEIETRHLCI